MFITDCIVSKGIIVLLTRNSKAVENTDECLPGMNDTGSGYMLDTMEQVN